MIGADPSCFARAMELFKPFMFEATDHIMTVNDFVYGVNETVVTSYSLQAGWKKRCLMASESIEHPLA